MTKSSTSRAVARISRRPLPASPVHAGALGPSRRIVYRLAALFSLDAFAGGFVVQSLLALWLFERFEMSLSAASLFFFWSGLLSAFSFPVAAWLSRHVGLINTMVFTHIPSSICLILAAFAPTCSDEAQLDRASQPGVSCRDDLVFASCAASVGLGSRTAFIFLSAARIDQFVPCRHSRDVSRRV